MEPHFHGHAFVTMTRPAHYRGSRYRVFNQDRQWERIANASKPSDPLHATPHALYRTRLVALLERIFRKGPRRIPGDGIGVKHRPGCRVESFRIFLPTVWRCNVRIFRGDVDDGAALAQGSIRDSTGHVAIFVSEAASGIQEVRERYVTYHAAKKTVRTAHPLASNGKCAV
jgi:hypothetical protein